MKFVMSCWQRHTRSAVASIIPPKLQGGSSASALAATENEHRSLTFLISRFGALWCVYVCVWAKQRELVLVVLWKIILILFGGADVC